jgi:hypothetical protein
LEVGENFDLTSGIFAPVRVVNVTVCELSLMEKAATVRACGGENCSLKIAAEAQRLSLNNNTGCRAKERAKA